MERPGLGARQRHRAVKPHHSKNLLSVNECVESQDWEAQEEADAWAGRRAALQAPRVTGEGFKQDINRFCSF